MIYPRIEWPEVRTKMGNLFVVTIRQTNRGNSYKTASLGGGSK